MSLHIHWGGQARPHLRFAPWGHPLEQTEVRTSRGRLPLLLTARPAAAPWGHSQEQAEVRTTRHRLPLLLTARACCCPLQALAWRHLRRSGSDLWLNWRTNHTQVLVGPRASPHQLLLCVLLCPVSCPALLTHTCTRACARTHTHTHTHTHTRRMHSLACRISAGSW